MRSPYIVKAIPNTERGQKAAKLLRAVGEAHHKKRGRGARGRFDQGWHQDLPMERATHFSLYAYPITRQYPVKPEYWNYQYFEFKGWKGDKPVIRQMPCKR